MEFELEASFHRLKRETLGDRVYEDIKGLLLSGQMPPGQRLTLRGLAGALGTSPMPVRDGVGRLVAERALELLPNRSLVVPKPTRGQFREIVAIRCELEGLAAEKAASSMTATQLVAIRSLAADFETHGKGKRPDEVSAIKSNRKFHFAIYEAAAMPLLFDMIEKLWIQVGAFFALSMSNKIHKLSEIEAFQHHRDLVAALERKDGVSARQAITSDIRDAAVRLLNHKIFASPGDELEDATTQPKLRL
jgi:DNA-binding GntR family transcriptional regulator